MPSHGRQPAEAEPPRPGWAPRSHRPPRLGRLVAPGRTAAPATLAGPAPAGHAAAGGPRWGAPPATGGWQQQGPWSRPAAPKPGVIPLRPLGVGEILDGSLATLRRHWRAILGVTFAVALVTQGIAVVVQGLFVDDTRIKNLQDDPDPSAHDILHALSGTYAGLGPHGPGRRARHARRHRHAHHGRQPRRARPSGHGRAKPGATPSPGCRSSSASRCCCMLLYIGVLAVAVLPGVLIAAGRTHETAAPPWPRSAGSADWSSLVWLWIQLCLAPPALMLEKQGIVAAMKRSAKLVRGSWWRALGVQLLAIVLVYFATSIIQLPFTLLGAAVYRRQLLDLLLGPTTPVGPILLFTGIGAVIASTITLPVSAGVTSLLYMDQRIRRESLDIELIRAAEQDRSAEQRPGSVEPRAPVGQRTARVADTGMDRKGHRAGGAGNAKKPQPPSLSSGAEASSIFVRRRPTLPQGPPCSTIGAERLSFRVRNVTGRFPNAMTTETL